MKKWFKKIWKDPVGSSVIALILFSALGSIGFWIKSIIKKWLSQNPESGIRNFLNGSSQISNILLLLILLIAIISIIYILYKIPIIVNSIKARKSALMKKKEEENYWKIQGHESWPIGFYEPSVIFHDRICAAFPGDEKFQVFNSKSNIYKRLKVLLEQPLSFRSKDNSGSYYSPIWWYSTMGCSNIQRFIPFKKRFNLVKPYKVLLNFYELNITKLIVSKPRSYYHSFVYIEVEAEKPTGIYNYSGEEVMERAKRNYWTEEYGQYRNRRISRSEFDDGSTIIRENPIDIRGQAELRIRHLAPTSFIIAHHGFPFTSDRFDILLDEYLPKIRGDEKYLKELIKLISKFPKHGY